MREFDYITNPAKLLTPEIVQMVDKTRSSKTIEHLCFRNAKFTLRGIVILC